MDDTSKDTVSLPLEESGKAVVTGRSSGAARGRSWWRTLALVFVGLLVGTTAGLYVQPILWPRLEQRGLVPPKISTLAGADAPEDRRPINYAALDVVALGRLVPNGGTLAVALPSGAGDARVARLLVSEGDQIEAGQVVAELDNLPQLLAAKSSAQSTVSEQEAALAQVRAVVSTSLAEARANRKSAEAAVILANQALARATTLAEHGLTTRALLQQVQSTAVKAAAELERTSTLVERFSGAEKGVQPDIVLALRNLDVASANLARATQDLASARVVAPRAGVVLEIHAHVGEKPTDTDGLMTIGDVTPMTAELEVYQTDIRNVALGQVVEITAPALNTPLAGKVTKIGQIVEHQSSMSTEPAANADARIVKVTVSLDEQSSTVARAYTNLEVVGRIGMSDQ